MHILILGIFDSLHLFLSLFSGALVPNQSRPQAFSNLCLIQSLRVVVHSGKKGKPLAEDMNASILTYGKGSEEKAKWPPITNTTGYFFNWGNKKRNAAMQVDILSGRLHEDGSLRQNGGRVPVKGQSQLRDSHPLCVLCVIQAAAWRVHISPLMR